MSQIILDLAGNVKEFIDDDGIKYELKGDCNNCGSCCSEIKVDISETQPCKFLDEDNLCKIYKSRPWYCLLFPRSPATKTFNNCSLTWQRR